jgi:hypothetical protein
MRSALLPDGSRVESWSAPTPSFLSWFESDPFWTLAELLRWRDESGMLDSLRALLADSLAAPDLTAWSDVRVLSEVSRRLADGRWVRLRNGEIAPRTTPVAAVEKAAPPPPLPKAAPKAPAPPPPRAAVQTAPFGPEAEGLRKAAVDGAAFYCDCDVCAKAKSAR